MIVIHLGRAPLRSFPCSSLDNGMAEGPNDLQANSQCTCAQGVHEKDIALEQGAADGKQGRSR